MIRYKIPTGVVLVKNESAFRLTTREGGQVGVDRTVCQLWEAASQSSLEDIICGFSSSSITPDQIRAGLACLAEAGLLEREGTCSETTKEEKSTLQCGLVSVIIVVHDSQPWLAECLSTIAGQSYPALEIIIVDNGSEDRSAEWIAQRHPQVRLLSLDGDVPLARAINAGIRAAQGDYLLLLNPDVRLQPDTVAHLVKALQENPGNVAAAAKLRLFWTPSFLNGLGNLVGALSWGTDIGLGHLDLGQFDDWEELPSACFAAVMIPAWAVESVGLLDGGFPLYYEDSEWCYRARLFGYRIQAAPAAVIHHAMSIETPSDTPQKPSAQKLRQVTYGRLRWMTIIPGKGALWRFFLGYLIEDLIRIILLSAARKKELVFAVVNGWIDYWHTWREIRRRRTDIQASRLLSDRALFQLQKNAPAPFIQAGFPQLTWDLICCHYLPLFQSGKTRPIPEWSLQPEDTRVNPDSSLPGWRRILGIWRDQGLNQLIRVIGRNLLWRLMQP